MTEISLKGRVALVTGAGRGLGAAHAVLLARRGAAVVVNDLGGSLQGEGTDAGPAHDVVARIRADGGQAVVSAHDISDATGAEAAVAAGVDEFGSLDIVVNNAGILRDSSFGKMTPEQWDAAIRVHLRGTFLVCRAAWGGMRERGYGRIVNTSSDSGLFGNFGQANYAAAKLGIVGLTRTLAIEGARNGIKANALAPVGVTRMTEKLMTPEAAADSAVEKVAAVVAYLASEECPVTGEIVSVRGSRVSRIFIGVSEGVRLDDLTPETVRDQWGAIWDTAAHSVPPAGQKG